MNATELHSALARVTGQRDVLLELLREAADVLHTLEPEDTEDPAALRGLRDRIADATGAVLQQLVDDRRSA